MNRATHPIEQQEVMAYLDGELAAARAAEVSAHLEQCAECRALAAQFRLVSRHFAAWQVEPAPQRLSARVTAALEERPPAERTQPVAIEPPRRSRTGRWVLGLAGGFAIFLLVLAISIPNLMRSRMSADRAALSRPAESIREYAAAKREQAEISPHLPRLHLEGVPGAGEVVAFLQQQPAAGMLPSGPMIIRSASLVVIVKEFENARAVMEQTVRRLQGYMANLALSGSSDTGRALTATLRLPSDKLDAALNELRKLGRVEQESQSGEEVTQQYVDLVARISNARNTEQRLIQVLRERTGKVADILAVEKEIARVREEIERMEAQRKSLENQVSFATLQVRLTEEHKAQLEVTPPSTMTRLWNDLVAGFRSVGDSAVGLLASVLRYGPILLFWFLLLFWPARYLWRKALQAVKS